MRTRTALLLTSGIGLATATLAWAGSTVDPGAAITLSDGSGEQSPDWDVAAKVKLQRLSNGMLVAVWGDGAGDPIYDVKKQGERRARDIFARTCNDKQADCTQLANWSSAVNISQTAALSSATTAWRGGEEAPLAYAGDSDKPNIYKVGGTLAVSWVDKYCPGGAQGSITYPTLQEREIPFSCTYISVSTDSGVTWSAPQQLSDGYRDAKQDVHRGSTSAWVVTWQEDPVGLQLGEADGPGDGASGANVSKGTDIWYTALSWDDLMAGAEFPEAVRLTDNFTKMGKSELDHSTDVESGNAGAARANLFLLGGTVQVAYEESKGSEGLLEGKVIRYHVFPWNQPPTSCELDGELCATSPDGYEMPGQDDPARMGCILSDPDENARRVRFFSQGTPGTESGVKTVLIWKQGLYDTGGPSDILMRRGAVPEGDTDKTAGLRAEDLWPAVAEDCTTIEGARDNEPAINLSSMTEDGGLLSADTDYNPLEDARAHRGIIKGDMIVLGYSYTPDWAVARYTDLENYVFWVRSSTDGGTTWSTPVDVSGEGQALLAEELGLEPEGINVKEPRIVKTPGNGPGCPTGDPAADDTTDTSDCSAGGTVLIAYGAETNVYEVMGGNEDLDLFVMRTLDKGATFEHAVRFAADPGAAEGESQLQITPDGNTIYATWFHEADGTDARFAISETHSWEDTGDTGGDDTGTDDTDDPKDTGLPVDTGDDTDPEPRCGCSATPTPASWAAGGLFLLGLTLLRRRRS